MFSSVPDLQTYHPSCLFDITWICHRNFKFHACKVKPINSPDWFYFPDSLFWLLPLATRFPVRKLRVSRGSSSVILHILTWTPHQVASILLSITHICHPLLCLFCLCPVQSLIIQHQDNESSLLVNLGVNLLIHRPVLSCTHMSKGLDHHAKLAKSLPCSKFSHGSPAL